MARVIVRSSTETPLMLADPIRISGVQLPEPALQNKMGGLCGQLHGIAQKTEKAVGCLRSESTWGWLQNPKVR